MNTKEIAMRKVGIVSAAVLFLASVAVAGEKVTESENTVQEKTVQSTNMQKEADQPGMKQSQGTTVEKQRETTTSDQMGDEITNKRVEVEKKSSATSTAEGTEAYSPGAVQEYHQQSETHHQGSTTEVEKK
jgi:hypothetical protein